MGFGLPLLQGCACSSSLHTSGLTLHKPRRVTAVLPGPGPPFPGASDRGAHPGVPARAVGGRGTWRPMGTRSSWPLSQHTSAAHGKRLGKFLNVRFSNICVYNVYFYMFFPWPASRSEGSFGVFMLLGGGCRLRCCRIVLLPQRVLAAPPPACLSLRGDRAFSFSGGRSEHGTRLSAAVTLVEMSAAREGDGSINIFHSPLSSKK